MSLRNMEIAGTATSRISKFPNSIQSANPLFGHAKHGAWTKRAVFCPRPAHANAGRAKRAGDQRATRPEFDHHSSELAFAPPGRTAMGSIPPAQNRSSSSDLPLHTYSILCNPIELLTFLGKY